MVKLDCKLTEISILTILVVFGASKGKGASSSNGSFAWIKRFHLSKNNRRTHRRTQTYTIAILQVFGLFLLFLRWFLRKVRRRFHDIRPVHWLLLSNFTFAMLHVQVFFRCISESLDSFICKHWIPTNRHQWTFSMRAFVLFWFVLRMNNTMHCSSSNSSCLF